MPVSTATTATRGPKAQPKSKPGAWDRPEREASHTKTGPGRKAKASASKAPRVEKAPASRALLPGMRSKWRYMEPVHIVKPVRAARIAAIKAKQAVAA